MCRKRTVLLTGLVVGGILGVIYAPKEGKETRQDIKACAKKIKKETKKNLKKCKRKIKDLEYKIERKLDEDVDII